MGVTQMMSTVRPSPGLLELREYTLSPGGFKKFLAVSERDSHHRKRLLPFLGMFTCDTGGDLNKITHIYSYKDFDERDCLRTAAAKDPDWVKYVDESRQYVVHQESKIMREATALYSTIGLLPAAEFQSPPSIPGNLPVYELRQYQLHPGYGSVPQLLKHFAHGLPSKLASDPGASMLVALAFTEVGTLNQVVELWRYASSQSCLRARQAARSAPEWQQTIASVTPGVQFFTSTLMRPVTFSPWS